LSSSETTEPTPESTSGTTDSSESTSSESTTTPSITSHKDDYIPGEGVVLFGEGWESGETVHIFVNDDEGKTWSHNADVTTADDGTLRYEFYLPDWFVATYSVTATGELSGTAQTTFTDSITFGSAQTNENGSSGAQSLAISRPNPCNPGADIMVAQITFTHGSDINGLAPPAGAPSWNLVRRTDRGTDLGQAIFWRLRQASDPNSFVWEFRHNGSLQAERAAGGIICYNGVDTTNPIVDSSGGFGDSSSLVAPEVNALAGSMLIGFFGFNKAESSTTLSTPTGMSERYVWKNQSSSGPMVKATEEIRATAGMTGSRTSSANNGTLSEKWVAQLVSLRPPATADTTAPTVTIASGTGSGGTDASPPVAVVTNGASSITWSANESGTYTVRRGGTDCATGTAHAGPTAYTSGTNVTTNFAAGDFTPDGTHTVRVCVTDAATNTGSDTATVTKDTAAPSSLIEFPVHGAFYNAAGYTAGCETAATGDICGTATDGTGSGVAKVEVSIQRGLFYWNETGFSSLLEELLPATGTTDWDREFAAANFDADGSYTIRSHATDSATNFESTNTVTFTIDNTDPLISVTHTAPDGTNGWNVTTPVTVTVAASDATSGLTGAPTCTVNSSPQTLTASGSGEWTFTRSADGTYAVSCSATDNAGNDNTDTDTVKIDTVDPTSAITFPVDDAFYNAASWTAGCEAGTDELCGTAADATSGVDDVEVKIEFGTVCWDGDSFEDICAGASAWLSTGGDETWDYPFTPPSDGSYTVRARAIDNAGHIESTSVAEFVFDDSDPTSSASSPDYDNDGSIEVTYTANDATSGLDKVDLYVKKLGDSTFSLEATDSTPSATGESFTYGVPGSSPANNGSYAFYTIATDNAGNVESKTTADDSTLFDDVAPSVTRRSAGDSCSTPGNAGWCRGTQTAGFTATDPGADGSPQTGSGLATDGAASRNFTSQSSTEGSNVMIASGSVTDRAGNTNPGINAGPYMIDSTAPSITITTPPAGTPTYTLNQEVAADYSCNDALSTLATCLGSVATGANIDTASVGNKDFQVTATDVAGNQSNLNHAYKVQYATGQCLGGPGRQILQPINADGSSVFKKGSTVPAKFRVCDANGVSIGTPGTVTDFKLVKKVSGLDEEIVSEPVFSTTPDTEFRWSSTDEQWIYNMATKNLATNTTFHYRIFLNDGTSIDFQFGIR
jgi:hypothetical protein